ncbi:MAG: prolyl oligopeptidase family serine peptidase [Alphaproteobacteria bacterium]|nr:prolyl oligopeptidase family serine peptidase [Alphaproteobacteria bacterium]
MLTGPSVPPQSGGKAKQLVILLHGLGASGDDLIGLVPAWAPLLPHAFFAAPHAPAPCDMAPPGYGHSFQWFTLREWTPAQMLAGARDAAEILNEFIDKTMQACGVAAAQTALVGFSQGTMMALHVALRRAEPLAGVLGYSGALLGSEVLAAEVKSKPPVFLVHGALDTVVPYPAMSYASAHLRQAGIDVQNLTCPMLGHGIDDAGIKAGGDFLKKVLGG